MKLQLVEYTCARCQTRFKAPEFLSGAYGEFLLRSHGCAEEAYLNAVDDPTYKEVGRLIKQDIRMVGAKPDILGAVVQGEYGAIACDPDSFGNVFKIGENPKCPVCGCQEMDYWEETDPAEFADLSLQPVTHVLWSSLSDQEKRARVEKVLSSSTLVGNKVR